MFLKNFDHRKKKPSYFSTINSGVSAGQNRTLRDKKLLHPTKPLLPSVSTVNTNSSDTPCNWNKLSAIMKAYLKSIKSVLLLGAMITLVHWYCLQQK